MVMACLAAFVVTLLIVGTANAADAEGTPIPWWGQALIALASTFGTALLGLLGRLLNQAFKYLAEKTRLAFLGEVDEFIMGYVTLLYNTEVEAAKDAAADGKLTEEEKQKFAAIPVELAKEHFGWNKLSKALGAGAEGWMASRVERGVTVAKNSGKAARASAPVNPT
jgi:hypothetical protein